MRYATREEVRELDRKAIEEYQIPSIVLMENAGAGATKKMLESIKSGPVAIFCGKGNNGGDGFVIARHLHNNNIPVQVYFVGDIAKVVPGSDPGINLNILQRMNIVPQVIFDLDSLKAHAEQAKKAEVVVDALFGTGLKGHLREPIASIIKEISSWDTPIFAVDIPSGLDANTGEVLGTSFSARLTTTFALPKVGFTKGEGPKLIGELAVIDISIPREIL